MTRIAELEREADERRRRFFATLQELEDRTKPSALAKDIVRSSYQALPAAELVRVARKNPVLSLSLAVLAGWFVLEIVKTRKSAPPRKQHARLFNARRPRPALALSSRKENSHGYK